jgi:Ser/Thr protein kinase RdoA (MazF antagonist)
MAGRELLWDVKHNSRLRPLLKHIEDDQRRELVQRLLDKFQEKTEPLLPKLRSQVIFNDLNPDNVLIFDGTDRVSGFIDFGDIVYSPLVVDIAVGAAYLLGCMFFYESSLKLFENFILLRIYFIVNFFIGNLFYDN